MLKNSVFFNQCVVIFILLFLLKLNKLIIKNCMAYAMACVMAYAMSVL